MEQTRKQITLNSLEEFNYHLPCEVLIYFTQREEIFYFDGKIYPFYIKETTDTSYIT